MSAKVLAFRNKCLQQQLQNAQFLRNWAKEKVAERQKAKEVSANGKPAQKG